VFTTNTNCPNQVFVFDWSIYRLFVLNKAWKLDSLQITIFVNVCSSWSFDEPKTRFENWITRNDVNGVSLCNLFYLITLMAYLCSQWTLNVQSNYFIFDCSIYRQFVLNTARIRDSLQKTIFVNFSKTWSMDQLKTRFETWITWNDVNSVSLFHLSYIIALMIWIPKFQIKYFIFIGRSTDYLC
jgi:hypothetical protein